VPPGEAEGFVETWRDVAEKTIKEEGNRIYRWVEAGWRGGVAAGAAGGDAERGSQPEGAWLTTLAELATCKSCPPAGHRAEVALYEVCRGCASYEFE